MTRARSYPGTAEAFSLIEVTLAIGLIAFALLGLLALLPAGLSTQRHAQEEARAVAVLDQVASAVRAARFTARINGHPNYAFPQNLSDSDRPALDPTTFYTTQPDWNYTFELLEDGMIRQRNVSAQPRQTLYFHIQPPASETAPVRVYAAVAWPWKPGDGGGATTLDQLRGREGFVDTVIYVSPKSY